MKNERLLYGFCKLDDGKNNVFIEYASGHECYGFTLRNKSRSMLSGVKQRRVFLMYIQYKVCQLYEFILFI